MTKTETKKLSVNLNLPNPLRDYQWKGVEFLLSSTFSLLADDMGLGKTVQVAVCLELLYRRGKFSRALIVVPSFLKLNWEFELNRWAQSLSVARIKGNSQQKLTYFYLPYNVIIGSYDDIRNIFFETTKIRPYDIIILDEAQYIKNPASKRSIACKMLKRQRSIALTGTPIENKKGDLISIFDFLDPGYLNVDLTKLQIHNLIKKNFLRRMKKEVLKDLPEVIEQEIFLDLSSKQLMSYNQELMDFRSNIQNFTQGNILALIGKLKQICNFDPVSEESVKYDFIESIIDDIKSGNLKVLIFSQYVKTLKWFKGNIKDIKGLETILFHGLMSEKDRNKALKQFKESGLPCIFLISLKAGGIGINLPEADIVILFDRWWNPAIESQAIDRANRFGRKKGLHVIKFLIKDTIEEKIDEILKNKKILFKKYIEEAISIPPPSILNEIINYLNI